MNILSVCGIAIMCAIIALAIRRHNGEISVLVSILGCVFIILSVIGATASVFSSVKRIFEMSNVSQRYLYILIKAIGICFISEFCIDCCKDAGENALANNVSIAGKLMVLVAALPLFEEILNFALNLVGA
jgi:stage III sporulation protein AD